MSEPEPKEVDTTVTVNGSGPRNDNGAETVSEKKGEDLSASIEAADEGKQRMGEKNDSAMKMALDVLDGGNEQKEHKDADVKMTEAENAEKYYDVQMTEAEDANITQSEDAKMAEAEEFKPEESDDFRKEKADDLKKEDGIKEAESENTEKEEAKEISGEEVEDAKKENAEDVINEKVEDMKKEEALNITNEEVEGTEKEKLENMRKEEVDNVDDIDKKDKKVEDKLVVEDSRDLMVEMHNGDIRKKVEENKKAGGAEGIQKKENRGQKVGEKAEPKEKEDGESKAEKEAKKKKEGEKKDKEATTPVGSSIERPVRQRKSVERLVEALERESVKPFVIEKGRGTPLKDIPNVAYKVAKKKAAELKLLHRTLFGRVGKAVDYKNHILQFSGFIWHESEDKQKTKIKEKLDKCVKDTLLDFCDLFDIPISKAKSNARKEELVAMLLDFMVAPHATTDVILSEKAESIKSKKRKRGGKGSGSKSSGLSGKMSSKEIDKSKHAPKTKGNHAHESEDEEEEDEECVASEEVALHNSESKGKESESEEAEEDDNNEDDSGKGKQETKSPNRGGSVNSKKLRVSAEPKKISSATTAKSLTKSSTSKHAESGDKANRGAKAVLREHKDAEPPTKEIVSSKTDPKEKGSAKKLTKSRAKSTESGPTKEELRKTIIEILTKVDFNTATFTDILKELGSHYDMDFTPRKAAIKLMIQEELTKLAEDDDENEDEEDEGDDK